MSQDVLYRRYRPSRFADLVGQDHIRTTLEQEIARGRVAHAYLFTGPKGVGKTTTARLLAKALNCEKRKDGESEPCGTCPMCTAIANGTALDLLEIDAASHTGVDHVREQIVDRAHFHPTQGAYKIYLIDEVHMLSLSAFNALLKTLEEPPSHVVFILATTEVHKVPETVISRCQRFDFRRIRQQDLITRLQDLSKREKVKVAVPILKRIAAVSEGSLRDAESLLGQIIALGESVITEELASLIVPPSRVEDAVGLLQDISAGRDAAALERINHLMDSGADPTSFGRDVVAAARQLLLSRIDPSLVQYGTAALDDAGQKKLASWLATVPVAWLQEALEQFMQAIPAIQRSQDVPQLPLEIAALTLSPEHAPYVPTAAPAPTAPRSAPVAPSAPKPAATPASKASKPTQPAINADAPAKNPEPKKPKHASSLTLTIVTEKWPRVLTAAKKRHHALRMVLDAAQPLDLVDDVLRLGVPYAFYQDRLHANETVTMLQEIFQQIYGTTFRIEGVVVTGRSATSSRPSGQAPLSISSAPSVQEPIVEDGSENLDELAKSFGGKIV